MNMVKRRADRIITKAEDTLKECQRNLITTDKVPQIDMNKGSPMILDRENAAMGLRVEYLILNTSFQPTTRKDKREKTKGKINNIQNFFLFNENITNLMRKSTIDILILLPNSFLSLVVSSRYEILYLKIA